MQTRVPRTQDPLLISISSCPVCSTHRPSTGWGPARFLPPSRDPARFTAPLDCRQPWDARAAKSARERQPAACGCVVTHRTKLRVCNQPLCSSERSQEAVADQQSPNSARCSLTLLVTTSHCFTCSPFSCADLLLWANRHATQISHQRCLRCAACAFYYKGQAYTAGNEKCCAVWFCTPKALWSSLNFLFSPSVKWD